MWGGQSQAGICVRMHYFLPRRLEKDKLLLPEELRGKKCLACVTRSFLTRRNQPKLVSYPPYQDSEDQKHQPPPCLLPITVCPLFSLPPLKKEAAHLFLILWQFTLGFHPPRSAFLSSPSPPLLGLSSSFSLVFRTDFLLTRKIYLASN